MIKVLVKYSEIALKGKNQHEFVNKLVGNIQKSANRQEIKIKNIIKEQSRIICNFEDKTDKDKINAALKNTFGIKYFCYAYEVKKDMESILEQAKIMLKEIKKENKNTVLSFKTKRNDKAFPVPSPDINHKLALLTQKIGLETKFKNADTTLFTEITFKTVYMYSKRMECFGGLPVGTSGRVLVLLSGGIDSPVSAIEMLKRGCTVDFLHFHTHPTENKSVLDTKMKRIVEVVNNYGFKSRLHLIPRRFYKMATIEQIKDRYQVVFFKHYILQVAQQIAKEYQYDAIVTGDSLAQVASQTMENLKAASINSDTLIFRPLLTYDKDDIIVKARGYGTYKLSIEEYADCCSLVAQNPLKKTNINKFKELVDNFEMDSLLEESMEKMESYMIK